MSSGMRKFFTILLGAIFVLAFIVFVLGLVARRDLLSPELYAEALSENNVYERIYTDLLADPVVQEQFKAATGIEINLLTEEAFAQIVGGLYLILPPAEMQSATEKFFTGLTAYLRGETDELPEDLDLGAALTPEVLAAGIAQAGGNIIFRTIDEATPIVVEKTAPIVENEVSAYLDQVTRGILGPIPGRLLGMTVGTVTRTQSERLTNVLLGPAAETASEETKMQIEGALAADDLTGAITIAVQERLTLRASAALVQAEAQLAQTDALIGISGAAAALGQTRDQVVASLNTARNLIATLQTVMWVALAVMLLCIFFIIWLNNDSLGDMLKAVGWTLTIASGLVMALWLVVGLILRSRLGAALAATNVGPTSLDGIVDDVVASLTQGVWNSVWTTALPWLIIGLVTLAFGYSRPLLDFLGRLLAPVWAYKWTVLAVVFGAVVLVPLLWRLITADDRAANLPCNGHAELCDRPINEVAYATSHNSMSIAEYGWVWPMHDGTITDQLNYGVRALLIDTHYIEDKGDPEFVASLPPAGQEFLQNAVDTFVPPAQEGLWLCHQFCALGYSPFDEMLTEVKTFLDENPREVLFMVIQDAVTSADTDQAFTEAGLVPYIYDHPDGQPWPTLRELIDSNQRLLVMAEEEGPPPAWYDNVWTVTEETPYTFIFPEQFNCEPNRGETGKPFFLLNHWIQRGAPNRVDGAVVNDYDFLLGRAQQCQAERGKLPNFIAVNWYSQGDLMEVVDTLNGFAPQPVE